MTTAVAPHTDRVVRTRYALGPKYNKLNNYNYKQEQTHKCTRCNTEWEGTTYQCFNCGHEE